MAEPIVFQVFDSDDNPKAGLSLSFTTYKNQNGDDISKPTIIELGGGFYSFNPLFSLGTLAVAYIINTGFNPSVVYSYVRHEDLDIFTLPASPQRLYFAVFRDNLTPAPSQDLEFVVFKNQVGANVTPPDIDKIGGGFYFFNVPLDEINTGFCYTIKQADLVSAAISAAGPIPTQSIDMSGTDKINAVPIYIPSDVSEIGIAVINRLLTPASLVTINSGIAIYSSDGYGNATGDPLHFEEEFDISSVSYSTTGSFPITRGPDGKIVVVYALPGATTAVAVSPNTSYGTYTTATTTVNPPPTPTGTNTSSSLVVRAEYTTLRNRFIVFGDNNAVGYSPAAVIKFTDTAWQLIGENQDCAIDIQASASNGSLSNYAMYSTNPYTYAWNQVAFTNNNVVIQLGTNDLAYNDLETMQESLTTIVAHLRTLGVSKIFAWTIPPQLTYPGTDAVRLAYNSWLLTNTLFLDGICDAAKPVSNGGLAKNTNHNVLNSAYAQADGTNLTIAGQAALANLWLTVIP